MKLIRLIRFDRGADDEWTAGFVLQVPAMRIAVKSGKLFWSYFLLNCTKKFQRAGVQRIFNDQS